MYGAVVAIMTGNYSAMFKRFNISLGDFRYDFAVVFHINGDIFYCITLYLERCYTWQKGNENKINFIEE